MGMYSTSRCANCELRQKSELLLSAICIILTTKGAEFLFS